MALDRRSFLVLASGALVGCMSGCVASVDEVNPSKSANAMEDFINSRGLVTARLTVPQLVDCVLAFYRDVRVSGLIKDSQADMLLYQWGTFNWGQGESFEIDITRQFVSAGGFGDNAISQQRCTAYFQPSKDLRAIPVSNRWCHSVYEIESFDKFIRNSACYHAVSPLTPIGVQVRWDKV